MESVLTLLRKAAQSASSQRRLAEWLECSEQNLSDMIAGRRGLTPRQCIKLAEVLDRNAREVLALDAVEREKDAARRRELLKGFFRSVAGAMVISLAYIDSQGAATVDALYIVACRLGLTRRRRKQTASSATVVDNPVKPRFRFPSVSLA